MTPMTHNLTGIALGLGVAALLPSKDAGLFFVGCVLGARAPDWMEIARFNPRTRQRESLIPHRTLTHWLWPWLALFLSAGIVYRAGGHNDQAALAIAGFAAAGLLHIATDCMTVMGCPLGASPFGKRTSLRMLKTGSAREVLVILAAFAMAGAGWAMR